MNENHASSRSEELDSLLWAMSVELKAIAAVGRATMQGVAAVSAEAASAIDSALEREGGAQGVPGLRALIEDARRRLKSA